MTLDKSAPAAVITGAASSFPAPASQVELWDGYFAKHFGHRRAARAAFAAAGVERRHAVANPLVEDVSCWSTGRRMARYLDEAMPLGKDALCRALENAGVTPEDVGLLVVASCTGYATPGLDVRLARDLDLADDLQRVLVGHVGCHAAIPAISLASDFVRLHHRPAAVLCVELTSLHVQPTTDDLEQVVVHALFGDAASAVVLESSLHYRCASGRHASAPDGPDARAGLEVLDVATVSDLGASDHMTWDVTDLGFRMGLSRRVPDVVGSHVAELVDSLLARNGAMRRDVTGWAVHPGGRRILDVVGQRLGLGPDELDASRSVLADHGNCSSATILIVIDQLVTARPPAPGALVVAIAFGPGLTLCAVLLRACVRQFPT